MTDLHRLCVSVARGTKSGRLLDVAIYLVAASYKTNEGTGRLS